MNDTAIALLILSLTLTIVGAGVVITCRWVTHWL